MTQITEKSGWRFEERTVPMTHEEFAAVLDVLSQSPSLAGLRIEEEPFTADSLDEAMDALIEAHRPAEVQ